MSFEIDAGLTSQTIDVFIGDSSSAVGAGLTGLAYDTSGLYCYYRKGATGTVTPLPLATQTVTGAYSSGGFVELSATDMPGMYRLDLPDGVVDTEGLVHLLLHGAANMVPCPIRINCRPNMFGHRGLAQAGASGSITLHTNASSTDDFYNGALVVVTGGTGVGQVRRITDYVGSTRVATVDANWVTNPDSTSRYRIIGRIA